MKKNPFRLVSALLAITNLSFSYAAPQLSVDPWHQKAEIMLEKTVNIPTVVGRGRVLELANYLANQYRAAGIPDQDIHVMPYNQTAALIVRWRAEKPSNKKPIMVMGHVDVVEAKKEDWSKDPFVFVKQDGYYYGRGTLDMKNGLVATTVAILKLKEQGFKSNRDIIVFYTGDEETGGIGAQKGATEWKNLLDAEYGLNADGGGGGFSPDGRPLGFGIQTAEKTYADYTFTVRNSGGHSSKPKPDNAIYQLSSALKRLESYRFEPVLTETTRAYFTARAKEEKNPLGDAMRAWLKDPKDAAAADAIEAAPMEVGLTRTRCVATRLFAGHANNALPQLASANINCRIMPGVSPDLIKTELEKVVADPTVVVTRADKRVASLASPLRADILTAFQKSIQARFPTSPVMPEMSTGASDARPFRIAGIPVYGVNGAWAVVPDDWRAHGRDERLPVQSLADNVDHWVRLLTDLAS